MTKPTKTNDGESPPKVSSSTPNSESGKKKRLCRHDKMGTVKENIAASVRTKVKGMTDGLDGYYFDCTTKKQVDQFVEI